MATNYINTLIENSKGPGGVITKDVNYEDTKDFHEKTFEAHGLTLDNWTLTTPMEIVGEVAEALGLDSTQAQEGVWELVRDTEGEGVYALAASGLLTILVASEVDTDITDLGSSIEAMMWLLTTAQSLPEVFPTALTELLDAYLASNINAGIPLLMMGHALFDAIDLLDLESWIGGVDPCRQIRIVKLGRF